VRPKRQAVGESGRVWLFVSALAMLAPWRDLEWIPPLAWSRARASGNLSFGGLRCECAMSLFSFLECQEINILTVNYNIK